MSNDVLAMETHCFAYPSVEALLQQVNAANQDGNVDYIDAAGRQGLRIAGMFHIDDFRMITPLELCLISRIWPEKVHMLFAFVEEMLEEVHLQKQEDLDEMISYIH